MGRICFSAEIIQQVGFNKGWVGYAFPQWWDLDIQSASGYIVYFDRPHQPSIFLLRIYSPARLIFNAFIPFIDVNFFFCKILRSWWGGGGGKGRLKRKMKLGHKEKLKKRKEKEEKKKEKRKEKPNK